MNEFKRNMITVISFMALYFAVTFGYSAITYMNTEEKIFTLLCQIVSVCFAILINLILPRDEYEEERG